MKATAPNGLDLGWLESLSDSIPAYLARLAVPEQEGKYLPCERGATAIGREMGLGFGCFALKIQHMLGTWEQQPEPIRNSRLDFIRSFQRDGDTGSFIDEPEINFLTQGGRTWRERLWSILGRGKPADFAHSIVLAETKQALASLAEVGATAPRPFRDFPQTPESVRAFFLDRDWSKPWGAGGQCAGLVVFLKTQGPALLPPRDLEELLDICRELYSGLADQESGAYFRGRRPAHGELINGAMKVLMALDWLEIPPHHPQRLIQTCLAHPPSPDGCHLVDAIYVLHQCGGTEVSGTMRAFCAHVLELIRRHAHPDGGFSFFVERAQNNYYGVPISAGLDESDLHGTCLLTWALAMLWRMLTPEAAAWKTLRP